MNNYNMYALVDDRGIVENVRPFRTSEEANNAVKFLYLNGSAICVNNFIVWEGDKYDNGVFKRLDDETQEWIPVKLEKTILDEYSSQKEVLSSMHNRISFLEKKLKENGIEV